MAFRLFQPLGPMLRAKLQLLGSAGYSPEIDTGAEVTSYVPSCSKTTGFHIQSAQEDRTV